MLPSLLCTLARCNPAALPTLAPCPESHLQVYYGTPASHEIKGVWCHPCYGEIKTETVPLDGFNIRKAELEKRKNDDEVSALACGATAVCWSRCCMPGASAGVAPAGDACARAV